MNDAKYEILMREAATSADALALGLTSLRHANIGDRGRYYSGLTMVAVGLERLLKLLLVLDHVATTGRYPGRGYLKSKGHRISELLQAVRAFAQARNAGVSFAHLDSGVYASMISVLTDFAMYSRYHNLDSLSENPPAPETEPLRRWHQEVQVPIVQRHFRIRPEQRSWLDLAGVLDQASGSVVWHHKEDGTLVSSMQALASEAIILRTKQAFTCRYLQEIVVAPVEVLEFIELSGASRTDLREFFVTFQTHRGSQALRKRQWRVL